MPVVAQLGNVSYVICAMVGGILAINGIGSFTLGGLASFLTFNKSFNMPINQVSQQFNSIVMALAGAKRIFDLLDEKPEVDEATLLSSMQKRKTVFLPNPTNVPAAGHGSISTKLRVPLIISS